MSGKELFEGMSYVDDRFVDEAETRMIPKGEISPWMKVASMAACLCLILFSVYNLNQFLNRGAMEGLTGESAADQAWPGEGQEDGQESVMEQESLESITASPGDTPAGEVPSVILYIDEMTELGFIGTVAELVDTDILEIGMELNVIIAEDTRSETANEDSAVSEDSKATLIGTYVMVQFIEYNEDTQTIVINVIQEVDPPDATP